MLTALRRGSTSIARPLLSASTSPARIRSLRADRACQITPSFARPPASVRSFVASSTWYQRASEAIALEEEEVEAELEQEVHAPKPPSHAQIDRAVENGPVTKFQELGDRNMVCKTVVDTLTRDMGMETMTQVQSLTINESLKGIDMYVGFHVPSSWVCF